VLLPPLRMKAMGRGDGEIMEYASVSIVSGRVGELEK
jgi:hypothetical protein